MTAPSTVQIANRALTKLGAARIISFSDDNKQARALTSCFEDLRDDELRANRWQFALKRVSISADAAVPAFGYTLQYTLPPDFLKLDQVNNQFPDANMNDYVGAEDLDYVMEGNKILTNIAAPLKVRYIASITDPAQWDINFRETLASRVAMELAEELTQSNEKKKGAMEDYKRAIIRAIRSSSIEKMPVTMPDGAWMISRL